LRNSFWNRVLELIKILGMNQSTFAKRCGMNYDTLRGWISKGTIPFTEMTCYMAELLGVSVEYLVNGNVNGKNEKIRKMLNQMSRNLNRIPARPVIKKIY